MVSLALCKAAIMEYWHTGNTELLQEVGCQIAIENGEAAEQVTAPDAASGGYQPMCGNLDVSNPPRGGSGVPPRR